GITTPLRPPNPSRHERPPAGVWSGGSRGPCPGTDLRPLIARLRSVPPPLRPPLGDSPRANRTAKAAARRTNGSRGRHNRPSGLSPSLHSLQHLVGQRPSTTIAR